MTGVFTKLYETFAEPPLENVTAVFDVIGIIGCDVKVAKTELLVNEFPVVKNVAR